MSPGFYTLHGTILVRGKNIWTKTQVFLTTAILHKDHFHFLFAKLLSWRHQNLTFYFPASRIELIRRADLGVAVGCYCIWNTVLSQAPQHHLLLKLFTSCGTNLIARYGVARRVPAPFLFPGPFGVPVPCLGSDKILHPVNQAKHNFLTLCAARVSKRKIQRQRPILRLFLGLYI